MCSDCANSQIYLLEVMLIASMTVFLVHHFPTGLHIFCKCSYTGLKTSSACMWGKLRNDYIMKLYNLYHWSEWVNDRARDKQHPRLRRLYQQHCRGYISMTSAGKSPASPAVIRALTLSDLEKRKRRGPIFPADLSAMIVTSDQQRSNSAYLPIWGRGVLLGGRPLSLIPRDGAHCFQILGSLTAIPFDLEGSNSAQ